MRNKRQGFSCCNYLVHLRYECIMSTCIKLMRRTNKDSTDRWMQCPGMNAKLAKSEEESSASLR